MFNTLNPWPILTPLPPLTPRINGPRVLGVRPDSPFLHTISATGQRPMRFDAHDLPPGLTLAPLTGRITGHLSRPGSHLVTLLATNSLGQDRRPLRIVVGPTIALTPPMGWNSWNCWGPHIDQPKILQAAQAMVASGLINHGWSYINIDDGWQGDRTPALQPNEKFPDMQTLCDAIHAAGLKAGIYSTPWTRSFANFTGGSTGQPQAIPRDIAKGWYVGAQTYEHEDARQWAQWGIDYLKYDWGPMDLPSGRRMREALLACVRDIIFNPTNSAPDEDFLAWTQLAECYFLWRRPKQGDNDIKDSWASVSSIGFRMYQWTPFAGPGRWNDPDMLVVGHVGWGQDLHPCALTADEQYSHMSLWCLLAAPLLLGCDLTQLDPFTLNLLTNDEVLAVNQDPLGKMADRVSTQGDIEVWAKPLEGGALAVGLFNRGDQSQPATLRWRDLAIQGPRLVRDLWRQQNHGVFADTLELPLPSHGVALLHLS